MGSVHSGAFSWVGFWVASTTEAEGLSVTTTGSVDGMRVLVGVGDDDGGTEAEGDGESVLVESRAGVGISVLTVGVGFLVRI